jgi:hypothetical protein
VRRALLAGLLLLGGCAAETVRTCPKRDFTPDASEDAAKALEERAAAARAKGRERFFERKRIDPDFPSEPERRIGERHERAGEDCWRSGWYDDALLELEAAASYLPPPRRL